MALLKLLCGVFGLAAVLPLWPVLRNFEVLRPLLLEPPGLGAAIRALPERRLSRDEQETLRRDGCLLVRGVVNDTRILEELLPAMQQHENSEEAEYVRAHTYNGPVRALLREGPLGALLADAMQAQGVLLYGVLVWGSPGGEQVSITSWHQDAASTPEVATVWLAMTPAPHALEFVRGSHRIGDEIMGKCNESYLKGKPGERLAEHYCVMELAKERLEPEVGEQAHVWEDLQPGDAWLFLGAELHRGVYWPRERLALAVRVVPHHCDVPRRGDRGQEVVPCIHHRTRGEEVQPWIHHRGERDVARIRDIALPRPQWLWPQIHDTLPLGSGASAKALRWTVATVTQAAFGRSHSLRAALTRLKQKVLQWKAGSTHGSEWKYLLDF